MVTEVEEEQQNHLWSPAQTIACFSTGWKLKIPFSKQWKGDIKQDNIPLDWYLTCISRHSNQSVERSFFAISYQVASKGSNGVSLPLKTERIVVDLPQQTFEFPLQSVLPTKGSRTEISKSLCLVFNLLSVFLYICIYVISNFALLFASSTWKNFTCGIQGLPFPSWR